MWASTSTLPRGWAAAVSATPRGAAAAAARARTALGAHSASTVPAISARRAPLACLTPGHVIVAAVSTASVRERVAAGGRRLAAEGLVLGTAGNVSARDGEIIAITPSGEALQGLRADQIAVIDLDGKHVEGALGPSSELGLHLGIYHRYGAGAVVHAHSPVATALACVIDELPVVHYNMLALGGSVRVAPYETFGTAELAEVTLAALHGRSAALMANHGTVVHGPSVEQAVDNALLLEWCCEVYWRAAQIGQPRTPECRAARGRRQAPVPGRRNGPEARRNHNHTGDARHMKQPKPITRRRFVAGTLASGAAAAMPASAEAAKRRHKPKRTAAARIRRGRRRGRRRRLRRADRGP